MTKPTSICIFGDSTSWGAWDLERGGWATRLWLDVGNRDRDEYVDIYNLSVPGGDTGTILERFESEAKVRGADAIIFQTGGNDASYKSTPDNFVVPIEHFRKNIEEIIRRAKFITEKIIFTDLKNCNETETMPVSWIDIYYTNDNIQKYSQVMREICVKNGVLFMEINPLANSDFEDGLHPNAAGHQKIFEQVKSFLEKEGWV